jgi:hypothetical protein
MNDNGVVTRDPTVRLVAQVVGHACRSEQRQIRDGVDQGQSPTAQLGLAEGRGFRLDGMEGLDMSRSEGIGPGAGQYLFGAAGLVGDRD